VSKRALSPTRPPWRLALAAAVTGGLAAATWWVPPGRVPALPERPAELFRTPDRDAYARTLAAVVDDQGRVDYDQLIAHPADLDAWYRSVVWLDPEAPERWDEPTRIAFWCNAYNGLTLLTIRENHPIGRSLFGTLTLAPAGSIRQIPRVWSRLHFQVATEPVTLDHIEHGILRSRFTEPRIHVAINCASEGCPALRSEPYDGPGLEAQLDDQVRRMVNSPGRFLLDRDHGRVRLSRIFRWFATDFTAPERGYGEHPPAVRGALAFLARGLPPEDAAWLERGQYTVDWLPYDWHLNDSVGEDPYTARVPVGPDPL